MQLGLPENVKTQDLSNIVTHINMTVERINDALDEFGKSNAARRSVGENIGILNTEIAEMSKIVDSVISLSKNLSIVAFNAMVEAQRARAAGAEFLVVAREIRNISEKTEAFAKQIVSNVEKLSGSAKDAQKNMDLAKQQGALMTQKLGSVAELSKTLEKDVESIK